MSDIWNDFIGDYSICEILECLEAPTSILEGMTLGQAIEFIVGSIYDDKDYWRKIPGYREVIRAAYPDKDKVIRTIKQEVIRDLELE